jgi:hypothetical protein
LSVQTQRVLEKIICRKQEGILVLWLVLPFHLQSLIYTGYFTSDNEPDGIENATHNTFAKLSTVKMNTYMVHQHFMFVSSTKSVQVRWNVIGCNIFSEKPKIQN